MMETQKDWYRGDGAAGRTRTVLAVPASTVNLDQRVNSFSSAIADDG